jgi:tRNA threonylcarbamoyladenosine biosynthesis protein TsaB
MTLLLNTADSDQTALYLLSKDSIRAHVWPSKRTQQESLHSEIEKFLKKYKVKIQDIKKVAVVVGPGAFSRIRTGVVTANTLAYALGIPVVGIKNSEEIDFQAVMDKKGTKSVDVFYDRAPNITQPKPKK